MGTFQHYVPRVYLQGFTDPATPTSQEPYVWVLDSKQKSVKRRSPRNIAGENDYYESVGITGGPGAGVESRLARIEGRFKAELDRITAQGVHACGFDDRIIWFLATLGVRTPWGRRAIEQLLEHHPPAAGGLVGLSEQEQWAASVEYLAEWAAEYFRRMDWLLIGPMVPDLFFCTSDRPVVLTGSHMDGSSMDILRLTEKSAVVTVPLTSRLALIGSYDRANFLDRGVSVEWINDRTIENSERFVFLSHSPNNP